MSVQPYREVVPIVRVELSPANLAIARAALGQGVRAAVVVLASGLFFLLVQSPFVAPWLLILLGLFAFSYERRLKRRATAALSPLGPGETSVSFLASGIRLEHSGVVRDVPYALLRPYRRAAGAVVLRGEELLLVLPIRSLEPEQLIALGRALEGRLKQEDPRWQWIPTLLAVGAVLFLFLWWTKS